MKKKGQCCFAACVAPIGSATIGAASKRHRINHAGKAQGNFFALCRCNAGNQSRKTEGERYGSMPQESSRLRALSPGPTQLQIKLDVTIRMNR